MSLAMMAALATTPTPAAAQSSKADRDLDLPLAGVITNPDWAERPNGDDLANHFPPLAQMMGISGVANMKCRVTVTGDLTQCEILLEQPLGLGFGKATLDVATSFKMKPQRLDGAPVAGGEVIIPLRWLVPSNADDAATAAPSPPVGLDGRPPSATSLATARRMVEAMGVRESLATWSAAATETITRSLDASGDEAHATEHAAAVDAIKTSAAGMGSRLAERQAQSYAAHLSEAELAQAVAFYESPAGKAVVTEQRALATKSQGGYQDAWRTFAADARARFCQKVSCAAQQTLVLSTKSGVQGAKPVRAK